MSSMYQRVEANQQASRTIEQFAPLISKYAFKFHQRAVGLKASMDMDDIRQELSLILTKCSRSYDETKGGSFMNFLITAWFNEMNRLMRRDQRNMEVGVTIAAERNGDDDGESYNLMETVNSGWASPEENVEALSSLQFALDGLTDQARVLVEVLMDPPEAVCKQFDLQGRGAEARREAGVSNKRSTRQLNMKFLFDLFRVPSDAAKSLQAEIEKNMNLAFDL